MTGHPHRPRPRSTTPDTLEAVVREVVQVLDNMGINVDNVTAALVNRVQPHIDATVDEKLEQTARHFENAVIYGDTGKAVATHLRTLKQEPAP